jgi:gamma-glutamyltranspeptidase/glutathione hydrolase
VTTQRGGGRVGPKEPVTGSSAVCASQHPIVTDTMLAVLRAGGNAADAAVAGCLVQATVQQEMSNHAGSVTCLYWDASAGRVHDLNSRGTIVPGLAPFRRVPSGKGYYASLGEPPLAVIPGFMPGLKALYERFGTRPWSALCEPAIRVAEEGYEVGSFEQLVLGQTVDFFLYTASGRAHFTPDGHLPQVGDVWRKPELAATLRGLAADGPDHFISGAWAQAFVARANELGWSIELRHMEGIPVRWGEGRRYPHRGHEIVQLSAPDRQGVFSALVLGMLAALDVPSLGHYSESAEALYFMAHALRRAHQERGILNDPQIFDDPSETLMSPAFHGLLAEVLRASRPKADLSAHVELVHGKPALAAGGSPLEPAGSCEISVVDAEGNWVQLMHTLQTGGIPGEVVGGVPMVGSHARSTLDAVTGGWFTGGGRLNSSMGHTFVLRDGRPVWSLGTPGNVYWTVPQVLSNRLDYGLDPYAAEDAPRLLPLTDDYKVPVESRLAPAVPAGLARLGLLVDPLPAYDYHMGSFQMCWRDEDGTLHATAGPRRAGSAAAY